MHILARLTEVIRLSRFLELARDALYRYMRDHPEFKRKVDQHADFLDGYVLACETVFNRDSYSDPSAYTTPPDTLNEAKRLGYEAAIRALGIE